jgi:hypothetical protein
MSLSIVQPLQRLESFKIAPGCTLGNFLEPLMIAVTTTATPQLTAVMICFITHLLHFVTHICFHLVE